MEGEETQEQITIEDNLQMKINSGVIMQQMLW